MLKLSVSTTSPSARCAMLTAAVVKPGPAFLKIALARGAPGKIPGPVEFTTTSSWNQENNEKQLLYFMNNFVEFGDSKIVAWNLM